MKMVLSKGRKAIILGVICFCVVGVGIIPFFTPLYIFDYSHINWHGADLSEGVVGDHTYFDDFPNFTQPSHLFVYDVRGFPYEQQLVLTTLQGLVNRANTSLYLIYRDSDQFWLERLNEYYGVNYTYLNNETYWQVIELFNQSIAGVICYDPAFLDSVNVATFLAGLNECVVIHPNMLNNFSSSYGFSPLYDFRGNFTSRVEIYTWAFENFWFLANQKMIASRPPEKVYFRDYIVGSSPPIFTFWLHCGPFGNKAEIDLFRRIMAETPPNIPVWGWFTDPGGALGEYEAVKTISHAGKYSFCAAIPDLTVLSAFEDTNLIQKPVNFNASAFPLENKVYASIIVSDGDNMNYVTEYLLDNIWQNPDRGSIPLGFTLEPLMSRICPVGLRYYYENATTNEYFLAGPSGAGYCYVDMTPTFPRFLNRTKYAMDQCDMTQVWLLNGYEGYEMYYSDEIINAYTSTNLNLSGLFLDYHDFQAEPNYIVNGVPVFHSIWVERENEIIGKISSIKNINPKCPTFLWIACNSWDFNFTTIKNVANALPDVVFLRPDHFADLFKSYQIELKAESWLDENSVLLFTIIAFVSICTILVAMWVFLNNKSSENLVPTNSNSNTLFRNVIKLFYVAVDVTFLLALRYCLYSTILNIIYLLLFLISLTLGIYLRSALERLIGLRATIYLALGLASTGIILFTISPQFSIILGFSLGILISQQLQSNYLLFSSPEIGKRSFLYTFIIAATIILLVPFPYYSHLLWISAIIFISISIIVCILLKRPQLPYFRGISVKIRHWYLKGVLFGVLFTFLLAPTFASERFFFYISWGLEYFPTKSTIAFAVATSYLLAIAVLEFFRLRKASISCLKGILFFVLGILVYILVPFLIHHPISFIITNFLFIFGLLAIINAFILSTVHPSSLPQQLPQIDSPHKHLSGFLSQFTFWTIIGFVLAFVPPTILVVDSQAVFELLGIIGIEQLTWSPAIWSLFYTPPLYMFIAIPIMIFILIFGIIKTLLG